MIELGMSEYNSAEQAFARNDFAAANLRAQNAINLFQEAYAAERASTILNFTLAAVAVVVVGSAAIYLARRRKSN